MLISTGAAAAQLSLSLSQLSAFRASVSPPVFAEAG